MKKLLTLVVLCGLVPAASAVDVFGTDIGVTAEVEFMSRYIWRGYNRMGSSPVWTPSVDFDLGGGFGASLAAYYANNAGQVDNTEYQYTLYYGGSALEGDVWKTDYVAGWRYYDLIDTSSKGSRNTGRQDLQELFVELEMPQLVGAGIVPRLSTYYVWQARSGFNPAAADAGFEKFGYGWIFMGGFDYNFDIPELPEAPMTFSWDIAYNEGTGPGVDQDWSHMTWGLKSEIACPMTGGTITPQVYFQNTFESSLNTDHSGPTNRDYLYCGISYSIGF